MIKKPTPQQQILELTDKLDCCMCELKRFKEGYSALSKRAKKAERALGIIAMGRGKVRLPAPVRIEAIRPTEYVSVMECPIIEVESWKFADSTMHELMEMRRKEPYPPILEY